MVFDAKLTKIMIDGKETNIKLVVSKWLEDDLAYLSSRTSTEFAFYLAQYEVKDYRGNKYFVIPHQEIIIPKQKASAAEVEITENLPYPINGHKHPEGVTTFSSTDLEYITNNATISLLVTSNGIQEATIRFIQNIDVIGSTLLLIRVKDILRMFDEPKDFNVDAKVKELEEKMEKPKYEVPKYYYGDDWYYKYLYDDDYLDGKKKKKSKK